MIDWLYSHIPVWIFITLIVHVVVLGAVAYLILLERKTASWVQDRIGPNRVGFGGLIPLLIAPMGLLLPKESFAKLEAIAEKLRLKHMFGLGQPLADGLKFIVKEDYRPKGTDAVLFSLAPAAMVFVVIISIAVIPWGGIRQASREIASTDPHLTAAGAAQYIASGSTLVGEPQPISSSGNDYIYKITYQYPFQIASLNIGVLFVLATLSLAVYGVVIGGWASNNKYSFLGGLRATANMISYEIPLGLAVLTIALMYASLDMGDIVEKQAHYWGHIVPAWNCFCHPLAFVMFLICIHAEANRAPFDLAEAEQELVGGYHTEYSSMRFALFFLGEYAGMVTTSAVCVALFFGGWHFPFADRATLAVANFFGFHNAPIDLAHPAVTTSWAVCIVRAGIFFVKTLVIIFVFMWTRWSLPRFRFDQLMMLAWRALIPISLVLLLATTVVIYAFGGKSATYGVGGWMAVTLLIVNVIVGAIIMIVSTMLPPAPATNRPIAVPGSRYRRTPLPRGVQPVTA
jgi:NADH-quinone oxidoreductase subunit H